MKSLTVPGPTFGSCPARSVYQACGLLPSGRAFCAVRDEEETGSVCVRIYRRTREVDSLRCVFCTGRSEILYQPYVFGATSFRNGQELAVRRRDCMPNFITGM